MRRVLALSAIGIGLPLAFLVAGVAGAAGDPEQERADAVVREAIPGATGRLVQGAGGEPKGRLTVALPDQVAVGRQGASREVNYADSGWRANIAAAVIADRVPSLIDFAVTDPVGRRPPEAANVWGGVLRLSPGDSASAQLRKLNSITAYEARRQAEANLAVLEAGLPEQAIRGKRVTVLPVEAEANRFAVGIDVEVTSLPGVHGRLGDFVNGLATGLVGSLDATVEGVAIRVMDSDGLEVGSWTVPRSGSGSLYLDPRLSATPALNVSLPFVSLTGGPQPTSSATGNGSGDNRPSLTAAFGLKSTRVIANYVQCPNTSCPGGGEVSPSGFLEIGHGRFLRFDTERAADTVKIIVARRSEPDDATVRTVAFGDATTRATGRRLWRFKLPRNVGGARRVQVDVDYVEGPSASFNVRVQPRRSACG